MVYKNYNLQLAFRILFIILTGFGIGLMVGKAVSTLLVVALFLMLAFEVLYFVRFVNNTNRKLSFFIKAVRNNDTSLVFPDSTGSKVMNELHESLNGLNMVLQDIRIKSQVREHYFREILQHIAIGVIVFNDKWFVLNTNETTKNLFGLTTFTHLSQLERVDDKFKQELLSVGDTAGRLLVLKKRDDLVHLSVRSSTLKLKDETLTLVTLQDISGELERNGLDSWLKLIKVLNHEIMNSLVPVTSIAQSLRDLWRDRSVNGNAFIPGTSEIQKTIEGLDVISERGEALMRFVQGYRMFTRPPEVNVSSVTIYAFFDRLNILLSPLREQFKVTLRFHYPEDDFSVLMDEQLMVQVIINLVKNGAEAGLGLNNSAIDVSCKRLGLDQTEIAVADNGPGISESIAAEIFVPFFTTKKNGSGVGLSHSRQILRAHGGSITCRSKPGETIFFVIW